VLVDLGCGSGFWLDHYADEAEVVVGVEPDAELLAMARARNARARVVAGSAEHIPLPDSSVDVVHARFAYFFPPGCEAGLAEVRRVLRPGGRVVVIDNDYRHGQFAQLLARSARAAAQGRGETTDAWWDAQHAQRVEVMSEWRFDHRSALESVLRLEFPAELADSWLGEHPNDMGLSYGYVLFAL
ncbi:Methyltransferase type 11, partial [mine drainage metagenome]